MVSSRSRASLQRDVVFEISTAWSEPLNRVCNMSMYAMMTRRSNCCGKRLACTVAKYCDNGAQKCIIKNQSNKNACLFIILNQN